jgi:hypothetical protein
MKGPRVTKDSEAVWLHFEAPSGNKAAINLVAYAMTFGPVVKDTLLEWANAFREPGVEANVVWTKPYYGVQHTGKDAKGRWCSVQNNHQWSELHRWLGTGLCIGTSAHDTVEEARERGEAWLAE